MCIYILFSTAINYDCDKNKYKEKSLSIGVYVMCFHKCNCYSRFYIINFDVLTSLEINFKI